MSLSLDRLLSFMDAGGTVVTATRRLSRFLLERYADQRQIDGHRVWPTPEILHWDDWLTHCWREIEFNNTVQTDDSILLGDVQELYLWERVIHDAITRQPDFNPLQVSTTAAAARDAWYLLRSWSLTTDDLNEETNQDSGAFREWANEYSRLCSKQGWMSRSELSERIGDVLLTRAWSPSKAIAWVGFDELAPSQQKLSQRLENSGVAVEVVTSEDTVGTACYVPCRNSAHEIESAARWARAHIERKEAGPIGVVFHDLQPVRDEVEYVFNRVLHPGRRLDDAYQRSTFHLSLGKPLSQHPVIADAMLVLCCVSEARPLSEVSELIRSAFIRGGFTESSERDLLDLELRKYGPERVALPNLPQMVGKTHQDCPVLVECLRRLQVLTDQVSQRKSPAAWSSLFTQWLQQVGWPGDRVPDSSEYQAIRAWRESLTHFASLGLVTPSISVREAIAFFARIINERIFQPQAPPAQVHIMGSMEAGGMQFAHLWLIGMSSDQWPPAPRLNPFLPYALQRRLGMPGATPQRALAFADIVSQRLLSSAPNVVISYPLQREQQPVTLSPLFAQAREALPGSINLSEFEGYSHQLCKMRPQLERVLDIKGPPLESHEVLPGGVSVLRDQSGCPFRAFVHHRLGAQAPPEAELGLSAAERGSILHRCLARLGSVLNGHAALLRPSSAELNKLVEREVNMVLSQLPVADSAPFRREFIALERHRLVALIEEWLGVEKMREPFLIVAKEQKITLKTAGLELSLRVDRIDRCAGGALMVIDYKTGRQVSVSDWFSDRPADPQLPVYLLAASEPIIALAFAHVRRGKCALKGLGDRSLETGIRPFKDSRYNHGLDWADQRDRWQMVVAQLANAFKSGEASVDPRTRQVCNYCDVWPVCRVFEFVDVAEQRDADG